MGDRLATIDMGRKVRRGCCGGRWVPTGSPSNTMWPGPKPTSLPSGILIHPTVCLLWPRSPISATAELLFNLEKVSEFRKGLRIYAKFLNLYKVPNFRKKFLNLYNVSAFGKRF